MTRRRPRLLLDVLIAPDDAFRDLRFRPDLGFPILVLGGAAAILLVAQGALLEPALGTDPLTADLPHELRPAAGALWGLRLVLAFAAPLGIVLRGVAFGSVLHALQAAAGGRGGWRHCVSLVLHLETIFLVESLCTSILLGVVRPQGMEDVRALHLRAGLDLFWEPASPALAAGFAAVNAFTLWWGILLVRGMSRLSELSSRLAAALVTPLWIIAVMLRFLLQPR